jgi:electron transport complex protein RnfE
MTTTPPNLAPRPSIAPDAFDARIVAFALGIGPVLLFATTTARALVLAIAAALAIVGGQMLALLLRAVTRPETRLAIGLVAFAAALCAVGVLFDAFAPAWHATLATTLPLLVGCAAVVDSSPGSIRPSVPMALREAFAHAAIGAALLIAVGAVRELAGRGSLFAQIGTLAEGDAAARVIDADLLPIATAPVGAFLALAVVLACTRIVRARVMSKAAR